ncbi:hypothetical protein AOQ84DRAFT_303154 [Glonium stellatum]|uniref:Uncharacterized protein n=1 Tax=Glonium stellatum TaxID=574774 RepID=A0A8E2ER09_9PEZI|nr:hypothetical protein AOQ84DRAFT_303154 [Glonium stellatum]
MQANLKATLEKEDPIIPDSQDPFAMYLPLMDEILKLYDDSVWCIRDILRPIEKPKTNFESDFSMFQEVMRHSIHVGEVLNVSIKTTGEMRQCRKALLPLIQPKAPRSPILDKELPTWDKTDQRMNLQTQIFGNLSYRQQSNHQRLQTEISLAFNMLTQIDSKVLKADSKAMKTVASLTMVYLPATFASVSIPSH